MHIPVLLKEVIEYLNPEEGEIIVDATIDGGGYAREILKKIGKKGKLIGIDQDEEMINRLVIEGENVILINGNFRDLDNLLAPYKINKIDGIVFDLGMSSVHLEESGRGFSFQRNEPLIMTYKTKIEPSDLTARDIVNKWSEKDIEEILREYGEERYSRRIARAIVESRQEREILTTFDLVEIIRKSVPSGYRNNKRLNCCTRTFQALRIVVNDELNALRDGLEKGWNLLNKKGRMVVVSFHSLEDRIVKHFFKEKAQKGEGEILTKKPIQPSQEEVKRNPRSRSAKLRSIEKL